MLQALIVLKLISQMANFGFKMTILHSKIRDKHHFNKNIFYKMYS